jgi:hypothetical protein
MDREEQERIKTIVEAAAKKCKEICDFLGNYTIAFFGYQNGKVLQCGSGVLFRLGDAHFILTAAHVVNLAIPGAIPDFEATPMAAGAGLKASLGVPLDGFRILRAHDPVDLAIIELTDVKATEIKGEKKFLNLSHFDLTHKLPADEIYFILGYPFVESVTDMERKTVEAGIHGFFTTPYLFDREDLPSDEHDTAIHFVFDHTPADIRDYELPSPDFPKPGGISGCGMWRLNARGNEPEKWRPEDAKLIGIDHGYYKDNRVIIGTQIRHVVQLLRDNRPDLRAAIDLTFPSCHSA